MASEWVMYLSVVAIGVLMIAGVTLTFNSISMNTIENTVAVGLNEVVNTVAKEIKTVLELGMNADPLSRIAINRTFSLPFDFSGHKYQISFKVLPGANHWFIEAADITDENINEISYETIVPWRNVTLTNAAGTGLPLLLSENYQHHIDFFSAEGSESFRIYIW
ncbi:MAG: hypothetical protein ACTSP7_01475 [Candidatus Heimdallarchaeota archaeon]